MSCTCSIYPIVSNILLLTRDLLVGASDLRELCPTKSYGSLARVAGDSQPRSHHSSSPNIKLLPHIPPSTTHLQHLLMACTHINAPGQHPIPTALLCTELTSSRAPSSRTEPVGVPRGLHAVL